MTADAAFREVRVLLDRYLEVSNHYVRELRDHLKGYANSPSRLSDLIGRLEAIDASATDPTRGIDATAHEEPAKGQNIVQTADTLAALRISANEILERLDAPMEKVPHNFWWLKKWLQRDVLQIAAGFPSFTYTWDKMIDLNRLTLVPDSRFLRVRDTVSLATMEFERFIQALRRLTLLAETGVPAGTIQDDPVTNPDDVLRNLCTPLMACVDPGFDARVARVMSLLRRPKDSLEESIVLEAGGDIDALALVGLELGFTQCFGFVKLSKERRKTIIMSLLVCSKLFLIEASWRNARDMSGFAIALTGKMNVALNLDASEGTAMLRFNQFWARYKLGEEIHEEMDQWNVSSLHPRYSFMKSVLLRKFDDAIRILETLLPRRKSGEAGNFSFAEAEEWPILEDLRSSMQYEALKRRLDEQALR